MAASAPFLAGTMIQGLLVLNYSPDSYTFERWHGTLLYWAILAFSALVNIYGSRALPIIENLTMALHVMLFFVLLIVMCVVSPTKNSAAFVFGNFQNQSGWSNDGIAWCIGLLSSCYVLIGYDGATHLSEEMHNAAIGVPYAMVGSVVINAILGFAFLLAVLFCMGDITSALETTTGFPIIQIFYNITGNLRAASAMTSAVIVMAILATIPLMSSAARMAWAFARDGGESIPLCSFVAVTNLHCSRSTFRSIPLKSRKEQMHTYNIDFSHYFLPCSPRSNKHRLHVGIQCYTLSRNRGSSSIISHANHPPTLAPNQNAQQSVIWSVSTGESWLLH